MYKHDICVLKYDFENMKTIVLEKADAIVRDFILVFIVQNIYAFEL